MTKSMEQDLDTAEIKRRLEQRKEEIRQNARKIEMGLKSTHKNRAQRRQF